MDNNDNNSKKKMVIVPGDGKELDISKVYNHLNIDQSSSSDSPKKENIVIPNEKK